MNNMNNRMLNLLVMSAIGMGSIALSACTPTQSAQNTQAVSTAPTATVPATPAVSTPAAPAVATPNTSHASQMPDERVSRNENFSCKNGLSVNIQQNHIDSVILTLKTDNNQKVQLNISPSGSGALYTNASGLNNKKTEWHEGAGEVYFSFLDPYNNLVKTTCYKK